MDDNQKVCVCEYCGTRQTVPKYEDNYHKSADSENGDKPNTEVLLNRVTIFLADKNWKNADKYCEKALDINPECAEAYLGKLMAELKIDKFENLQNCNKVFIDYNNYKKTIQFADDKLQSEIYEALYNQAIHFMDNSSTKSCEKAIAVFDSIKNYKDSQKQIELCEKSKSDIVSQIKKKALKNIRMSIATGLDCTVGLKSDGTVVVASDDKYDVSDWKDIVAVSAGEAYRIIGLKSDGSVAVAGEDIYGEYDVPYWEDIAAISEGDYHTAGLYSDGCAISSVYKNMEAGVSDWTDIVAISAGGDHTVGLKSEGTVVAVGSNYYGQCDVSDWDVIVSISAGGAHTVGLKFDGRVVAVGSNHCRQCDVSDWTNIVAISAGGCHTVGLKSDGTVVAVGSNYYGQCDVSDWSDVVSISAGINHTVGLKSDGTVVAVGNNEYGQCDVSDWTDIALIPNFNSLEEMLAYDKEQQTKREEKRKKDIAKAKEKLNLEKTELNKKINDLLNDIDNHPQKSIIEETKFQISKLKNEKESLSFFEIGKKKTLQKQIDDFTYYLKEYTEDMEEDVANLEEEINIAKARIEEIDLELSI
ncbi:MAG: hypothetical protein MR773_05335 [Eubacterium coprostanoligenes]|nr:hypothetical protein [Eubacterium coprostanoligenes]